MDEGASVKKKPPYKIKAQFISIRLHEFNWGFLTLFMKSFLSIYNDLHVIIFFITFSPSQHMSLHRHHESLARSQPMIQGGELELSPHVVQLVLR